jgi:hypothetical protein
MKVGRAQCHDCCLRKSIQHGSANTPQEPFCYTLLGQLARGRLHHAVLGAGGKEGVVRLEPLPLIAQQLFHPSVCARQVFHMSPLPLLSCVVIRALD